jgi:hypothetical protein
MPDPIKSEGTFELKFKTEKSFTAFGQEYAKCYANMNTKGTLTAPAKAGANTYNIDFHLDCGCDTVLANFKVAYDKTFPSTARPTGLQQEQDRDWTGNVLLCKVRGGVPTVPTVPVRRGFTSRIPVTSTVTTLVSDLANQPWQDGYALGKGVNAVTGSLSAQALDAFSVTEAKSFNSNTAYSNIYSTSDVDKLINTSASGSYNMDGITINASTSYLNQIKQSELDMTILATYQVEYNDYDTISIASVKFAAPAQKLLDAGDFEKFRSLYGDYYLAGSRRVATFQAVYTISAQSEEDLTQVKAALGVSAPAMFTAEGEAEFKSATAHKNVSISFNLNMQGVSKSTPDWPKEPIGIETVQLYLAWFQKYNVPVPSRAEMIHYSQIDNRIPTTLPIDPNIFSAVGDIYFNTYLLQITLNSLPSTWQGSYPTKVHSVVQKVNANAQSLVQDAPTRQSLGSEVTALLNDLNNINQRYIFIQSVRKLQASEPGINAGQDQTRTFGSINYPNAANDPAFVIQFKSEHYEQQWHVGHRYHDFNLEVNGTIVQWQLHQVWDNGTDGQWWKTKQKNNSDFVLLNNGAAIHCESEYDRGFSNSLNVWFVDNSLIPGPVNEVLATAALATE